MSWVEKVLKGVVPCNFSIIRVTCNLLSEFMCRVHSVLF